MIHTKGSSEWRQKRSQPGSPAVNFCCKMGFLPLLQAGEASQHPLETSALPAARRQRGRFHPNCTCSPALLSPRTVPHLFLQVPYQEMLKKPPQLPMRTKASSEEPGYSVTFPHASFSYCLQTTLQFLCELCEPTPSIILSFPL